VGLKTTFLILCSIVLCWDDGRGQREKHHVLHTSYLNEYIHEGMLPIPVFLGLIVSSTQVLLC